MNCVPLVIFSQVFSFPLAFEKATAFFTMSAAPWSATDAAPAMTKFMSKQANKSLKTEVVRMKKSS
jgi:hypothetical protein